MRQLEMEKFNIEIQTLGALGSRSGPALKKDRRLMSEEDALFH
jgi:hypothetical protein